MTAYMLAAAIIGNCVIATVIAVVMYGLGCAIGSLITDWRDFSHRYDEAHRPQLVDVSNVHVIYPRDGVA